MSGKGGSKRGGDRSSGSKGSKNHSHGSKCGGDQSSGNKSSKNRSQGDKSDGHQSGGNKSCCNKSSGKSSGILTILLRIGVGTPNIRIHFDGTSHVGIYLGISDGSVILNVRGVITYIKLSSITAVEVGVKENRKRCGKQSWKCKKG